MFVYVGIYLYMFVYICICLYYSNNTNILGVDNQNLPRIVAIMAEVFMREVIQPTSEVGTRMVNLLRQIQVRSCVHLKSATSNY